MVNDMRSNTDIVKSTVKGMKLYCEIKMIEASSNILLDSSEELMAYYELCSNKEERNCVLERIEEIRDLLKSSLKELNMLREEALKFVNKDEENGNDISLAIASLLRNITKN